MDIETPPNLNSQEINCFNDIVKPQLEELYSYEYDEFLFGLVKIFISKKLNFDINTIKRILATFPKHNLDSINEIHCVSYTCKNETQNHIIRGRTLPIVHKIILYPKAIEKLRIVLAHEVGHVIYATKLNLIKRKNFAFRLLSTFKSIQFRSAAELNLYIEEQFAECYDNFINNRDRLKEFPLIHDFFITYVI